VRARAAALATEPELLRGRAPDGKLDQPPHAGCLRGVDQVDLPLGLPANAGSEQKNGVDSGERRPQRLGLGEVDRYRLEPIGPGRFGLVWRVICGAELVAVGRQLIDEGRSDVPPAPVTRIMARLLFDGCDWRRAVAINALPLTKPPWMHRHGH